jgi:hypothetical protein
MTEQENINQFLSGDRKKLISVALLERLAELPKSTLAHFLRGSRDLPQHHIDNVVRWLKLVGYIPVKPPCEHEWKEWGSDDIAVYLKCSVCGETQMRPDLH